MIRSPVQLHHKLLQGHPETGMSWPRLFSKSYVHFSRSSQALSEVLGTLLSQPDGHTEDGHCSKAHVDACFIKNRKRISVNCRTPDLPVPHHLLKRAQIHVHCVGDAIQPYRPLTPSSLSAFNLPSIRVFSNESCVRIK